MPNDKLNTLMSSSQRALGQPRVHFGRVHSAFCGWAAGFHVVTCRGHLRADLHRTFPRMEGGGGDEKLFKNINSVYIPFKIPSLQPIKNFKSKTNTLTHLTKTYDGVPKSRTI